MDEIGVERLILLYLREEDVRLLYYLYNCKTIVLYKLYRQMVL